MMPRWLHLALATAVVACATAACTEAPGHGGAASPQRTGLTSDAGLVVVPPVSSAQRAPVVQSDPPRSTDAGTESFVAWTEPAGVRALLRGDPVPEDDKDPRACNFEVPEQSCVPGAEAVEWDCKVGCARTCNDCAAECRAALTTCRGPCKGDASCETTCGQRTGACVQACLGTRDRCYTGECRRRVAHYNERWRKNFDCKSKLAPLEICNRTSACVEECQRKVDPSKAPSPACIGACKKKHADGCAQDFLDMATMGACSAFQTGI